MGRQGSKNKNAIVVPAPVPDLELEIHGFAPVIVSVVHHRTLDSMGRRQGHIGVIQRRRPVNLKRNGGRPWAAWACLTADGGPVGYLERFDCFSTEVRAREHAARAAKVSP